MNNTFISIYIQLNVILMSVLSLTVIIRRLIQTRKIIHITFGPIYILFTDKLKQAYQPLSIEKKLLFSSNVILFTCIFVFSYFIKCLEPVCLLLVGQREEIENNDNEQKTKSSQPSTSELSGQNADVTTALKSSQKKVSNDFDGILIYGILFSVYLFLNSAGLRIALLCLCFGDGLAPYGNIFHRPGKTFGGSLLCFLGSLVGLLVYKCDLKQALVCSFVCTAVERLSRKQDNLAIVLVVWVVSEVYSRIASN